jgi:hypothetical protein
VSKSFPDRDSIIQDDKDSNMHIGFDRYSYSFDPVRYAIKSKIE